MAENLLMSISQDEQERAIFRSRRKSQTAYQSDMDTAEDMRERRGKEIGISIGEKNRSIEIARNALQTKLAIADIVKLTGLTCEEIETPR